MYLDMYLQFYIKYQFSIFNFQEKLKNTFITTKKYIFIKIQPIGRHDKL